MKKECYTCKHAGCDPDGVYCGSKPSFDLTMFGASPNRMHNEGLCTIDERQLWEAKDGRSNAAALGNDDDA